VAQELMRHQDIKLTTKVYTDPRLLNLQGAVESITSVGEILHQILHQDEVPGRESESTDVHQSLDGDETAVAS
jgi:hypothetical protein